MDKQGPQYRRNALRARNIQDTRDFYTTRNLWGLAPLWHHAVMRISACQLADSVLCHGNLASDDSHVSPTGLTEKGASLKGSLYIGFAYAVKMNVRTRLDKVQTPWLYPKTCPLRSLTPKSDLEAMAESRRFVCGLRLHRPSVRRKHLLLRSEHRFPIFSKDFHHGFYLFCLPLLRSVAVSASFVPRQIHYMSTIFAVQPFSSVEECWNLFQPYGMGNDPSQSNTALEDAVATALRTIAGKPGDRTVDGNLLVIFLPQTSGVRPPAILFHEA